MSVEYSVPCLRHLRSDLNTDQEKPHEEYSGMRHDHSKSNDMLNAQRSLEGKAP